MTADQERSIRVADDLLSYPYAYAEKVTVTALRLAYVSRKMKQCNGNKS